MRDGMAKGCEDGCARMVKASSTSHAASVSAAESRREAAGLLAYFLLLTYEELEKKEEAALQRKRQATILLGDSRVTGTQCAHSSPHTLSLTLLTGIHTHTHTDGHDFASD